MRKIGIGFPSRKVYMYLWQDTEDYGVKHYLTDEEIRFINQVLHIDRKKGL